MEPDRDQAISRLSREYLAGRAAGRAPTVEDLKARYPELGDQVGEILKAFESVDEELSRALSEIDRSEETDVRSQSVLDRMEQLLGLKPAVRLGSAHPESGRPVSVSRSRIGKYVIEREIGHGGMGRVYLAFDRDLMRRVAIKVVNERFKGDPRILERFIEEAQATGQLEHPNVTPVYELGLTEQDEPFFTMKLVKGWTLKEVLENLFIGVRETKRRFSHHRLVQILQSVCMAVHCAHQKGVIHRDIKPDNIMIGNFGEVILMDWGLAKIRERAPDDDGGIEDRVETLGTEQGHVSEAGRIKGTPNYMAPEQAEGRTDSIDARTDVYALGATLYEILTYSPPYEGESVQEVLEKVRRAEILPPRKRAPRNRIPGSIEEICLKAMEKDPGRRYQSAEEFHDELQVYLDGTKEREQKRGEAKMLLDEGRRLLRGLKRDQEELVRIEEEHREIRGAIRPDATVEKKRELWRLEDSADVLRQAVARRFGLAMAVLSAALRHDPENSKALGVLGELYWIRFEEMERNGHATEASYYRARLEELDPERFAEKLKGDGTVTVQTNPPGAEVSLFEVVEKDRILVPSRERVLGETPIVRRGIGMGRYLVLIRKEGFAAIRLPVRIHRSERFQATVRLCPAGLVPPGFVLIPAGPFSSGDRKASSARLETRTTGDYGIEIHPVTCGEYMEFINDLARDDMDGAKRHSPRRAREDGYYWEIRDGVFRMPEPDPPHPWCPDMPVVGVSFEDALAYVEWRSRRDGRIYDLPGEDEWEKAARGTDGRAFPWGDRFEDTYCNNIHARPENPGIVSIHEYPRDCSPYGVRGMAGNVSDLCRGTPDAGGRCPVAARGGAWSYPGEQCRPAIRRLTEGDFVYDRFGFRLKWVPPEAGS